MTWKPHATVAAVIEEDGKFLLVEECVDGKNVFNQPAGHLEANESFINAVIRETEEETATIFKPDYLIGLYRWVLTAKDRTYLRLCFGGQLTGQLENQVLDPDIIRTHWLTYDEIIAKKASLRSPLVLECIDDYLSGKHYPLELLKDLE